jgi:hypothetical protein
MQCEVGGEVEEEERGQRNGKAGGRCKRSMRGHSVPRQVSSSRVRRQDRGEEAKSYMELAKKTRSSRVESSPDKPKSKAEQNRAEQSRADSCSRS